MGPPKSTLPGSQEKPPTLSIRQLIRVPIGTSRFLGSFTAEPSTVMQRSTRGMPVSIYSAILAREVTFMMIYPKEARRWPSPTTRPAAL